MLPISFPPGCTDLASRTEKINNWRECNLMRWDNGTTLRPVGGWEQRNIPAFTDKVRKMHKWSDNNNNLYTAYLCESHVYIESNGVITDITPTGGMVVPAGNNAGYGDYNYNYGMYGTMRPGESRLRLYTPVYSMDNWGQDLRVMTSADGRLLGWSPTTAATPLAPVPNAPINNRSFIVTPERHIMLFGMGGEFDKFGWSDQENDQNWAFTDVLSRAGYYNIEPKAPIVANTLFEGGIVMWTGAMAYIIQNVGLPYVYNYKPIGKTPIPLSGQCPTAMPDGIMWPSIDGFWVYDGSVPRVVRCDVWDYITRTMDVPSSRFSAAAVHLDNKGEVWWFYATLQEGTKDNTRFVCYDYRSRIWMMGKLARTCGFNYANDRFPIMSDGYLTWKHEVGFHYPASLELPWIETFNLAPDGGEHMITISKIKPDIMGDRTAIGFSMAKMNDRTQYNNQYYSPVRHVNQFGWVDIRETAVDMRLRLGMIAESDWSTIGPILFDWKMRGGK